MVDRAAGKVCIDPEKSAYLDRERHNMNMRVLSRDAVREGHSKTPGEDHLQQLRDRNGVSFR